MIKKTILLLGLSDASALEISKLLSQQNRYDLLSIPFEEQAMTRVLNQEKESHSLKCVLVDLDDSSKSQLILLDKFSKEKKLSSHTLLIALHSLNSKTKLKEVLGVVKSHLIYSIKKPLHAHEFQEILHQLRHDRIYHLITETAKKYL
ncbi:MAG: hypothetical protein PHV30_07505 [Candidatus Margulisbacteria bacterium]|nr:hypothetical protein [Candidatus Margulisiibacteriota bacterium]